MLHTDALLPMTWFQGAFPVTAIATATNTVGFRYRWALSLANKHYIFKGPRSIKATATLLRYKGACCSSSRRLWVCLVPMNSKLMSIQHAATHSLKGAMGAAEPSKSQVMLNVNV